MLLEGIVFQTTLTLIGSYGTVLYGDFAVQKETWSFKHVRKVSCIYVA